ncbi:MAG: FAD-dependent oxidoreductase, partial [Candidatus Omnitrophota bacterium]
SSKGIFKARYIINAAGLFADAISQMAGINDFKIMPRKGEEFILDKKKELLTRHLLFPLPSKTSKGILVIKTADGNPMIGPTAEQTQDKEDLSTSDEGLKKVLDSAKRLIPSVSATDIIAYFAGLRPVALRLRSGLPSVAVDDFIIRHEDKAPGFINVAGIQSPGLTAAPAIALMVAGILKEQGLALKKRLLFHGRRQKCVHLSDLALPEARKLIKKDASYGDIVCRCEMVSAKEVKDAIKRGAVTMDGIKFRTRAQAGRCHGSFCTTRIMKILAEEKNIALTAVTKKGSGSEIVLMDRGESEGA